METIDFVFMCLFGTVTACYICFYIKMADNIFGDD